MPPMREAIDVKIRYRIGGPIPRPSTPRGPGGTRATTAPRGDAAPSIAPGEPGRPRVQGPPSLPSAREDASDRRRPGSGIGARGPRVHGLYSEPSESGEPGRPTSTSALPPCPPTPDAGDRHARARVSTTGDREYTAPGSNPPNQDKTQAVGHDGDRQHRPGTRRVHRARGGIAGCAASPGGDASDRPARRPATRSPGPTSTSAPGPHCRVRHFAKTRTQAIADAAPQHHDEAPSTGPLRGIAPRTIRRLGDVAVSPATHAAVLAALVGLYAEPAARALYALAENRR